MARFLEWYLDSDSSENDNVDEQLLRGDSASGESDGGGGANGEDDDDDDGEEYPFDITLPATHSYMGSGLVSVGGRSVLEPGWSGTVPAIAYHGCVFPGEIVPMILLHGNDAAVLSNAIKLNRLFGLLCPDESGTRLSGYGVLCDVFEAALQPDADDAPATLSFKARATQRFRLLSLRRHNMPMPAYTRMRLVEAEVLAETAARDVPPERLASLQALRPARRATQLRLRSMDAALTPWPAFVYDMFDYHRMRRTIQEFFRPLALELPPDPVSLSFWAASNLALAPRERLALFETDHALLRLHLECKIIQQKTALCCAACTSVIASRENIFAMSSEGVQSNYINPGGYMHDIVTVSCTSNTALRGSPSAEYSWFPGYAWSVAVCGVCKTHIGWRFLALKRNLRPHSFYGLSRKNVTTCAPPSADRAALLASDEDELASGCGPPNTVNTGSIVLVASLFLILAIRRL